MSAVIDQKSYLQKYLSGPSGDKKKKKKKSVKGKGFKIIDDDIDVSKLRPLDGDELDIYDEGEDAPQIAGIIDDRPEELKQLEQLKTSSKWKVINQDDGFNSKIQIEEIKKDHKVGEKENELIFGKMYSDSEDDKNNDSDLSPPRKQTNKQNNVETSKHNSDSDFSPPRMKEKQINNRDSNQSPSRPIKVKEKIKKPSRWGDKEDIIHSTEERHSKKDNNTSPKKVKRNYESDQSPPRKSRKDESKSNRYTKSYDSDISPPRRSKDKRKKSPESKSPSKRKKHSPNRHHKQNNKSDKRKYSSDSDLSPPRNRETSPKRSRKSPVKRKYDSDESPPRKQKKDTQKRYKDSPPPTNKKMAKTLDGKMAGLQDAKQLRLENDEYRRREEEVFNKMSDDVSGRNAKAISRKGKRETSEDRQKQREKAKRQKEIDEKYKKWSRGLKQIEDQEARVQEFLHESAKPLARHKDDRDLEHNLKQMDRAGDPMLQYIKEKKRERGELGPEKPSYKGSFPPNRFNIRPGYRWDGVDRSNGYEKKYFEQQSKRKAQQEEIYKWSTEDL